VQPGKSESYVLEFLPNASYCDTELISLLDLARLVTDFARL